MKKTFRSILVLALITAMMACLIVPVSAEEEIPFEEPAQEEFFELEEAPEEEFYDEPEEEFYDEPEEEPVEEEPVEEEPVEEEPAVEEEPVEEPAEEPTVEEPTEEPSAEPTEEPTEVPAEEVPAEEVPAEEEPAESEEEADSVEFDAELEVLLMNDEAVELFFGDEVTLQAVVYFANLDYVIRWEANANIDGVEEWFTVDETDTPFFTFELTEENALWQYRATLVAVEDEAEA